MDEPRELRILLLEDVATDAELVVRALRAAGLKFAARRVDTREAFVAALGEFKPDVVLADYKLPNFDGRTALGIVRRAHPEVPVVMVTGSLGDEAAIDLLKAGAKDYVLKDNLARLGPAVQRVLSMERGIRQRKAAEWALRLSEARYRHLFEGAQDGILIVDANSGRIDDANPSLLALLDSTHDQIVGKRLWEIGVFRDPEAYEVFKSTGYTRDDDLPLVTQDGRRVDVELIANVYRYDDIQVVQCNIRDVTPRKQAQAAQRVSELKFRALTENSSDITTLIEPGGTVRYDSPSIERLLGYAPGELLGRNAFDLIHPDDLARTREALDATAREPGVLHSMEHRLRHKDGSWRIYETRACYFPDEPAIQGVVINARDISDRKQAEEALRSSELRFRALTENSSDMTTVIGRDGMIRYESPANQRLFGYPPGELLGQNVFGVIHPDDLARTQESLAAALRVPGTVHTVEHRLHHKDGRWLAFESKGIYLPNVPGIEGVVVNSRDISERREAEAALRASEARFRSLIENSSDMITQLARDGTILYESPSVARLLGFRTDERLGRSIFELMHPDDRERVMQIFRDAVQEPGAVRTLEFRVRHQDGGYRHFESIGKNLLADPSVASVVANSRDVTERKNTERALQKINRALKTLSAGNEALVRATDEPDLLVRVCRTIVETGSYRQAWVGYAQRDAAKSIAPVAQNGFEAGFLEGRGLSWDEHDPAREPAAEAIRSGRVQIARMDEADPPATSVCAEARRRGSVSCIAFPLAIDGEVSGALSIYAAEPDAFDPEEVGLLAELVGDLAFGIASQRTRVERNRLQEEALRNTERHRQMLVETIRAIALTVEKRDPYTAGHQQRVAELVVAIGRELGLEAERIEGMRLGAMIHDIGKIYAPAEILNRPGRLTPPEFEIIKSHPDVGYDIVKDVQFPWPVADMIRQHHERLDGSGYPRGLKGEDIRFEAHILAVADVVEAMLSHRPYRPALGLDAALREIEGKRGRCFEARAVDACLRLFREKGFAFST